MSGVERIAFWIVMTGLATTLVLPGRQTSQVAKVLGDVFTGGLKTSQGR